MDLTWVHIIILITSGLIVGFINTIAGGGTIISLSVLMLLGLPPIVANGTNRVAIIAQNITAVINFHRKKLIDWKKSFKLAIPVVLGTVIGAIIGNHISNDFFKYIFGVIAIFFAISLIFQPGRWLKEKENLVRQNVTPAMHILFFFIGIYGGFIHVGIGYFFLAALVLWLGYDLIRANAMKNLLVLIYVPVSLLIYAKEGNVNWTYGLIHAIGNVIGAQLAVYFAVRKGARFVRYIMIFLIFIVILQFFGLIDVEKWMPSLGF